MFTIFQFLIHGKEQDIGNFCASPVEKYTWVPNLKGGHVILSTVVGLYHIRSACTGGAKM